MVRAVRYGYPRVSCVHKKLHCVVSAPWQVQADVSPAALIRIRVKPIGVVKNRKIHSLIFPPYGRDIYCDNCSFLGTAYAGQAKGLSIGQYQPFMDVAHAVTAGGHCKLLRPCFGKICKERVFIHSHAIVLHSDTDTV